jgi:flavin reductase (DIM6/NTAB) family NADH-FMN oxidoreductase RutF
VRTDVGVPRWLGAATRARCEAIGVIEAGDTTTAYDRIVRVAAQRRPDPCAGMPPPARAG